jgi:hypothetical protein
MDKLSFISTLKSENPSNDLKLECANYFISNYPVEIVVKHPFFGNVIGKQWTALQGITITGGSDEKVNQAFNSLKGRIKELEEFV